MRPEARPLALGNIRRIKDMTARRRQLIEISTMEKNRLDVMPAFLAGDIRRHIRHIQSQIDKLDRQIAALVEQIDEWREKRDILLSVPGIGTQVVNTLLADLPELGMLTKNRSPPWLASLPSIVTAALSEANDGYAAGEPL